jgi:hypothetical protein
MSGARIVTSNHVRGETWTFLRRRDGHRTAVAFLDVLERSVWVDVVQVSQELEDQVLRWLRRHDEREYSFVDATSFALMRSLRMRAVTDVIALGGGLGSQRRRPAGAGASAPNAAPHCVQNRISGSLAAPHAPQTWLSTAPQRPQKREPAGLSVAQAGQTIEPSVDPKPPRQATGSSGAGRRRACRRPIRLPTARGAGRGAGERWPPSSAA